MTEAGALASAMQAWCRCIGEAAVLSGVRARERYGAAATGAERTISGALRPRSTDDVSVIVKIAGRHAIPLYPISTGNNWGYGAALPVRNGSIVLDLSGLDRIVEMDADLGLVTVEPGVTQQKLSDYLAAKGLQFLVPVTGAGPDCSLIGNALERGYGITPYADHFGAVTALEAVLPDGRLYRSALSELGGGAVDRAYKWGIGPYLDGLFAQSALGIVTQMTIALAPQPEAVRAFVFSVEDDSGLEAAVTGVQRVLREVGGVTGSINLMNSHRVLAMTVPYPAERVDRSGTLAPSVIAELAKANDIAAWTGFGALYGNPKVVRAAGAAIRHSLKRVTRVCAFSLLKPSPRSTAGSIGSRDSAAAHCRVRPQPWPRRCSWSSGNRAAWHYPSPIGEQRGSFLVPRVNPARDGCGLIWYSPLVPMASASVRRYVTMVHKVCSRHGIEPLITLTSLSDRCFDSSVPLLFDRSDANATRRAHACYLALLEAGKNAGFLPYRIGIQAMDWLVRPGLPYWDLVATIKSAIDPQGIISPGRYGP